MISVKHFIWGWWSISSLIFSLFENQVLNKLKQHQQTTISGRFLSDFLFFITKVLHVDQKFRKQSGFPKRQLFRLSLREEKIVVYRALQTDFGFFVIAFSFCLVFQKSYCNKHINVKIYLNAPADKNNSGFHANKNGGELYLMERTRGFISNWVCTFFCFKSKRKWDFSECQINISYS